MPKGQGMGVGHRVLVQEERMRIVEWIAQYKSDAEIQVLAKTQFGKSLTVNNVNAYRHSDRWQPFIAKYRQLYLSKLTDVPVAQARVRFERMEQLYQQAGQDATIPTWRSRQEQRDILRLATKEAEVAQPAMNVQVTNVQLLSTEELQAQRKALLTQLKTLEVEDVQREA